MTDKIIVLSTCSSPQEAEKIALELINQRLAACVNILPGVQSFYRWRGAVESATEWLLVIKTSRGLFDEVRASLEKLHTYEVPEIVALPVVEGSENYLNWLEGELGA